MRIRKSLDQLEPEINPLTLGTYPLNDLVNSFEVEFDHSLPYVHDLVRSLEQHQEMVWVLSPGHGIDDFIKIGPVDGRKQLQAGYNSLFVVNFLKEFIFNWDIVASLLILRGFV